MVDQGEKGLEKVRRTQRGSRESSTSFQRSSQSLDAWQPCLQASTGSLQGFYRMFRISTGSSVIPTRCSAIRVLGDGWVNELYGWIGR